MSPYCLLTVIPSKRITENIHNDKVNNCIACLASIYAHSAQSHIFLSPDNLQDVNKNRVYAIRGADNNNEPLVPTIFM